MHQPAGERWHSDAKNGKPPKDSLFMPAPPPGADDPVTRGLLDRVDERFPGSFGTLRLFLWQVTRAGTEAARDRSLAGTLPQFGEAQGAMLSDCCQGCVYDPKLKRGEGACPWGALCFVARHADRCAGNHRMRMIVRAWEGGPPGAPAALRPGRAAHMDWLRIRSRVRLSGRPAA